MNKESKLFNSYISFKKKNTADYIWKWYVSYLDRTIFNIQAGCSKQLPISIGLKIEFDKDEDLSLFFSCFVFCYIGIKLPIFWMNKFQKSLPKYEYDREISISFYRGLLSWAFWVSDNIGYKNSFRKGRFSFSNLFKNYKNR